MPTQSENPAISPESQAVIRTLTPAQVQAIDSALLGQVSLEWRKVARVVGEAMLSQTNRVKGVPDLFYAERLRALVGSEQLQAQGNLESIMHSEVRRFSEEQ